MVLYAAATMSDASTATVNTLEGLSRQLKMASSELDKLIAETLTAITVPQWHVLAALADGDPLPMASLQTATQLTGPSLTRLIDGMINDNLVLRKVGETDRRRVLVYPTRRGLRTYQDQQQKLGTARDLAVAVSPALLGELDTLLQEIAPAKPR